MKLENLIISSDKKIKLIDFGFSVWAKKEGKLKIFCGTPSYMALEIISKSEYGGPPTDIWACGVILFVQLSGTFPFVSSVTSELYRRITKGIFSVPAHVSTSAR